MRVLVPSLLVVPFLVAAVPLEAQQSFTLAGERVAVYNLAGRVSLTAGSGSAVTVTAKPGGAEGRKLTFEQGDVRGRPALRVMYPFDEVAYGEGNSSTQLRVNADGTFDGGGWGKKGRAVRISPDRGSEAWADLTVAVPAGRSVEVFLGVGSVSATNVKGNLSVDVSAADVKVTAFSGSLSVDAGSGNVEVSNTDGAITIDTGSGDVTGNAVRTGELNIDTGSGRVELVALQASSVRIDTGSGDVRLQFANDPGDVGIDSGSGDVELALPAAAGAQVELETGSGDIRSDFALQVTRSGSDELRGTLGDGRGRLEVETGSGDVSLLRR